VGIIIKFMQISRFTFRVLLARSLQKQIAWHFVDA